MVQYHQELQSGPQKEALKQLQVIIKQHKTITLVYGAKNETENNAQVLYDLLQ